MTASSFVRLGRDTDQHAVWHYMNEKKVPQLFPGTGATKWDDPKGHPWTMGFFISYQAEGHIYAAYILKNKPDAKIAVLYQNDDFGKDYLKGVVDGLGAKAASMIKAKTFLRDHGPDRRLADRRVAGGGLRCPRHGRDPQIRRPGDQEDGGNRMEAAAHPEWHRLVGRSDPEAGRSRKREGNHQRQFLQGPH